MTNPRIRLLALHASYQCRHRGVCCTEEWAIPVEQVRHRRLVKALGSRELRPSRADGPFFEPAAGVDPDAGAVVGRRGRECVFFESDQGRLCAIHRDLGHAALPSACQHFPRVVVIDPRGITMTLSHVCPTVSDLLFADVDRWSRIVGSGPVVIDGLEWAGLDARDALPPQVNASLLWDWDAMTVFEERTVDLLARETPERALFVAQEAARELHLTTRGPLADRVHEAFVAAEMPSGELDVDVDGLTTLAERCGAGASVGRPDQPPGPASRERLDRLWQAHHTQVGRFLAAHALASAVTYHAQDVRVWSSWLQTAYAVLRSTLARRIERGGNESPRAVFEAAAGEADRLLVHRIDAARLAAALLARSAIPS